MAEGTWDGPITRLGDTTGDYMRWKGQVLQIRDLPEYKLRKLWKLNFSPKDIENDKHWSVYPPPGERVRVKPGMQPGEGRGRALTERGLQRCYATVLLHEAERILQFHRLDANMLQQVRANVATFNRTTIWVLSG